MQTNTQTNQEHPVKCDLDVPQGITSMPLKDDMQLVLFNSIESIRAQWQKINTKGTLSSPEYFTALEKSTPEGLDLYYGVVVEGNVPKAVLFFQVRDMNLGEALDLHTHETSLFARFSTWVKRSILNLIRHDLLVVGNVLVTGQYGINFCDSVPKEDRSNILQSSIESVTNHFNKEKSHKIKSILLKDFDDTEESNLYLDDYTRFTVDPVMNMDISPNWNSFDDYLNDFKSKYRVRYKRALKKANGINVHELSLAELLEYKPRMHELYKQISQNVSFNLFNLQDDYFIELKKALRDDIIIKGLFYENEMIAFYTLIKTKGELDAHFIGYDMDKNRELQTYQNMLYLMVNDSIELKVKKLHLSRTALEIKSTVGAVGQDLSLYIKYNGNLGNKLLNKYLPSFNPPVQWTPRSPFKGS